MKRSSVLISAVAGMIIGGITLGGVATASSGPTISGTVVAAQGTGMGVGGAWKVDGSGVTQPVSGTVSATQNGSWAVTVTPSKHYSDECAGNFCSASAITSPVLVTNVSINVSVDAGAALEEGCEVFVDDPNLGHVEENWIPMFEQGTAPGVNYWVGDSQVDLAVAVGQTLGAACLTPTSSFTATFEGEVTS
jgi:hypothetical protein